MQRLIHNFKKLVIIIYICLLNTITTNASEPETFNQYNFIGLKAGIVQPTPLYGNTGLDTGNPTSAAGALIGIKFHNILSIDLEYMHRAKTTTEEASPGETENSTSWSAESDTVMLNLSIDIMTNTKMTPYLRGGAGMSRNESYTYSVYSPETQRFSYYPGKITNDFAWQAGCGVNFDISPKFITSIEYMFISRGEIRTESYYLRSNGKRVNVDNYIHAHLTDHVATFGLKMKF